MNTEELIQHLDENEDVSAEDLLNQLNPKLKSRFNRAITSLRKVVEEIREEYPDAQIYVDNDNVNLMLGETHTSVDADRIASPNDQLSAVHNTTLNGIIGGGGW